MLLWLDAEDSTNFLLLLSMPESSILMICCDNRFTLFLCRSVVMLSSEVDSAVTCFSYLYSADEDSSDPDVSTEVSSMHFITCDSKTCTCFFTWKVLPSTVAEFEAERKKKHLLFYHLICIVRCFGTNIL